MGCGAVFMQDVTVPPNPVMNNDVQHAGYSYSIIGHAIYNINYTTIHIPCLYSRSELG